MSKLNILSVKKTSPHYVDNKRNSRGITFLLKYISVISRKQCQTNILLIVILLNAILLCCMNNSLTYSRHA